MSAAIQKFLNLKPNQALSIIEALKISEDAFFNQSKYVLSDIDKEELSEIKKYIEKISKHYPDEEFV